MEDARLERRLGVRDAVGIGLAAMVGAGIFAALSPAAEAAGEALLVSLALAAAVAYANATSSAHLAMRYPASGGTYVYGRERLGPFWGYLAGWAFVVGKTASCAAMALTVGAYAWPEHSRAVAVAVVVAVTVVDALGVQRSSAVAQVVVGVVLLVLVVVVVVCLASGSADAGTLRLEGVTAAGVLQGAGLLFFAFAGFARIATLGEEVRDPVRTLGRAVPLALGIAVVTYAAVAYAALAVLGADGLAASTDPVAAAVAAAGAPALVPAVRVTACVAAAGSLLALVLGISRTVLAMSRDGHLPRTLSAVHPRARVPHHATIGVGAVVAVLAVASDLRGSIGFSSFGVLVYYAIANASALTLGADDRRPPPALAWFGLAGCLVLALALPLASVLMGVAVLAVGATVYLVRRR
ncbi:MULTISPECIES: APC family permease [Mumia]|uniref:APC family permease n=1 Tax=Mumia xiangluensis TaxID=1678900 RepID=A0ABW1QKC7_9ACTN|nr:MULTISPECIES: amino acid permease [Mumia]